MTDMTDMTEVTDFITDPARCSAAAFRRSEERGWARDAAAGRDMAPGGAPDVMPLAATPAAAGEETTQDEGSRIVLGGLAGFVLSAIGWIALVLALTVGGFGGGK